jgi:hypothetical protein
LPREAFNGIGRIVERPNRPDDSDRVSRDDLVFPEGVIHIVNVNGRTSLTLNPRSCAVRYRGEQTTTVEGGTRRFAGATGRFVDTAIGYGVAPRKRNGSCDMTRGPLIEVLTISMTGTLTF